MHGSNLTGTTVNFHRMKGIPVWWAAVAGVAVRAETLRFGKPEVVGSAYYVTGFEGFGDGKNAFGPVVSTNRAAMFECVHRTLSQLCHAASM